MENNKTKKSKKKYLIILGVIIALIMFAMGVATQKGDRVDDLYYGGFWVGITIIIIGCCLKSQKKTDKEFVKNIAVTEEYLEYRYKIVNTDQKILKKIYNSEYSIEDVYLEAYKDNTAIKVILLKNDDIIGDILEEDVQSILDLKIKTSQIIVEHKLNNDGKMEYLGEIYGKIKKTLSDN